MNGEFVRFFHRGATGTPVEIDLYDMSGAVRALAAGEIFWITDLNTNGSLHTVAGPKYDWLYDDPDDGGRTDANTIMGTYGVLTVLKMRRAGFTYPCPVRRLMRVSTDDANAGTNWWGHGLIRSV